jgi:hypothetical protein
MAVAFRPTSPRGAVRPAALPNGIVLVKQVVVRALCYGGLMGSLTEPEYRREEIRKRRDGEDQPRIRRKDTRHEQADEDGPRQEERIDGCLAHRNECVSHFLKNGHSCNPVFLEPSGSMAIESLSSSTRRLSHSYLLFSCQKGIFVLSLPIVFSLSIRTAPLSPSAHQSSRE